MNPKKQKQKDRRRARKLSDEAWEAVNEGNLDLGEKLIRRAVNAQPDNPVLWNDQGLVLGLRDKEAEAAECFRAAINLAPTFAEPFANLAAMRARQGYTREALALQEQAVKLAPANSCFADRLESYRAMAGDCRAEIIGADGQDPGSQTVSANWSERWDCLNWEELGEVLTREGCVRLPALLDERTCAGLCQSFENDAIFARTVVMDRPEFGLGVYKYFKQPIPEVVDQLRRAIYPHVAVIANRWQELLGEAERFPPEWEGFRDVCQLAGQTTPTPILLKYVAGGFNALHRDLRGSVFFPIQLAVVLSPTADGGSGSVGFRGGQFLLCDYPEGKKARRREIEAGLGEGILFCTRDRLVPIGGAHGLQPVKHGVTQITAGFRFVLGVPFHEYR